MVSNYDICTGSLEACQIFLNSFARKLWNVRLTLEKLSHLSMLHMCIVTLYRFETYNFIVHVRSFKANEVVHWKWEASRMRKLCGLMTATSGTIYVLKYRCVQLNSITCVLNKMHECHIHADSIIRVLLVDCQWWHAPVNPLAMGIKNKKCAQSWIR